jgi:tRNA threonylcarbamoyladenosine biosynthesis protein TsaE
MGALGARIARELRAGDVIALNGELGAGKTTFTRGLGEALEVRGPVTSPTFVLARTHPSLVGGPPLVHVDAYRLATPPSSTTSTSTSRHPIVVVEWAAGMLDADRRCLARDQTSSAPSAGSRKGSEEGIEPRIAAHRGPWASSWGRH